MSLATTAPYEDTEGYVVLNEKVEHKIKEKDIGFREAGMQQRT